MQLLVSDFKNKMYLINKIPLMVHPLCLCESDKNHVVPVYL